MRTLSCLLIVLLLALAACTPDEVVLEESVVSAPISVTRETATPEAVVVGETAVPCQPYNPEASRCAWRVVSGRRYLGVQRRV